MHHVPYSHRLHDGSTVIQYIYDAHYDGARRVEEYGARWRALHGLMDDERYAAVLKQLEYQAGQAVVWRDAVSRWFHRASGVEDARGRVGHYPGRVEAESMELTGYTPAAVTPWEAASGTGAVECPVASCTAAFAFAGGDGPHDIVVQYFDVNTGAARYRLRAGGRVIGEWTAADRLPTRKLDGSSSTRYVLRGVALKKGDRVEVEGTPEGSETAALDYVELAPAAQQAGGRALSGR